MEETQDQSVDVRVLAKKKYELYQQQKKAHEELERLGLTNEQIEARINSQQQTQTKKQEGEFQIFQQQQGFVSNKQSNDYDKQKQRNQILTELTMKITEKFQKELAQDSKNKTKQKEGIQLEQKISKEIENCTCPICYELMVPPNNSPILIFPCGHTFCKTCIIPKDKTKLNKCPFCRKPLQSYAVNIHLQNIICAYTDNKHLLEKYKDEIEDINNSCFDDSQQKKGKSSMAANMDKINVEGQAFEQNYKLFSLRCQILEQEKDEILEQINKQQSSIQTHSAVIESLQKQKFTVQQKLQKLQQELLLVENFIDQNSKALQESEDNLAKETEKLELLNQTLIPLQSERQKYMILSQNQKK
ncbi:hypothetical protein ABPG72_018937 [Tetrahymena utriculariae]